MATKKPKPMTRKEALKEALEKINEKFGDGAIMRMGDQPVQKVDVISTGILALDMALGIGGLPRGRVVEIYGVEGSGKTTLALHSIAEAQKAGGIAAFIDAEHALDPRLAAALGVNVEELYLAQPDSGEQALLALEALVRSSAVDIVVVDSVAALAPEAEIAADMQKGPSVGLQARLMSYGLRRLTASIAHSRCCVVFINQLRATINTGYQRGPMETTAGGRALKFYSSVRIDVRRRGQITKKTGEAIGQEMLIKVIKNKLAPPFRAAQASMIYGQGIPRTLSIIDAAIETEVLKSRVGWLSFKGETLAQGKEKLTAYLDEHPVLREEIRDAVLATEKSLGYDPEGEYNSVDEAI